MLAADICRLENLANTLEGVMAARAELFFDSFADVPRRIVPEIDGICDAVRSQQQRAFLHAYYGERCFLPIHIYQALTGKPVAVIP
jgi:hypothetical protein